MIFLDSWIWLEFVFDGNKADEAEKGLECTDSDDAVHIAIASVHDDCHTLYSGDPDFEDIDELETVVL